MQGMLVGKQNVVCGRLGMGIGIGKEHGWSGCRGTNLCTGYDGTLPDPASYIAPADSQPLPEARHSQVEPEAYNTAARSKATPPLPPHRTHGPLPAARRE